MRTFLFICAGLMLALLAGCNGDDTTTPPVTTVSFSGTVVDSATGAPVTGATVAVSQNSVPITSTTSGDTDGTFTVANLTPGAGYVIEVTKADSEYLPTYFAPLTINENISGRFLEIFTQTQVLALMPTLNPPAAGTATLLVYGRDAADNMVAVSATVDALPASESNIPAVVQNITPGTYTVTVNSANGSVAVPNVNLRSGVFTVLNATVP
jgi:hypothetical protein